MRKAIVWIPLFLFILIVVSVGIHLGQNLLSTPNTAVATSAPVSKTQYGGQGMAFGIQETQDGKYWRTYQVPERASFRGFVYLLNQGPTEEYLLSCLVDYRQVSCSFDEQQQLLYRMSLGNSEERTLPFETPALSAGLHDLAVLAFARPDAHDLSPGYRLSTDLAYLFAPRAVLLVGDEPWQAPTTEHVVTGTQPDTTISPLEGLVVNRDEQDLEIRAWMTQTAKSGEAIEYFIHLGNDTGPSQAFAVTAFLDYEQVPLNGAEQWVAYVSLPTGTRATLPGRFVAPQETGVHEFVVVMVYDPYQMLEEPPLAAERRLTRFEDVTEPSIRIAIVVEE